MWSIQVVADVVLPSPDEETHMSVYNIHMQWTVWKQDTSVRLVLGRSGFRDEDQWMTLEPFTVDWGGPQPQWWNKKDPGPVFGITGRKKKSQGAKTEKIMVLG